MLLNEFPFFGADLINLISEEDLSGLKVNQPVKLMEYNDQWLLSQAGEHVVVSCAKADRPQLSSLTRRDNIRWLLARAHQRDLQLQYLAPVEIMPLDLDLGVDGLIADDLFTKNEIATNSIELACRWMVEHFVVNTILPDSGEDERWLVIARFSNASAGASTTRRAFQLLGRGWRADVDGERDGRYLIKRITRHPRRDNAFSLLTGGFLFSDASAASAMRSAVDQAVLDAALRDNGSYLELWNLYNDKEWDAALKQAETLKALRFSHADAYEDGRTNRWRVWPMSSEAFNEFRDRWQSLDIPKTAQVDLSATPPDWAEELVVDSAPDVLQQIPRGEIRFVDDHVIFTLSSNRRDAFPQFSPQENSRNKGGWLYLSLAGQRMVGKRRLNARQAIDSGKRMPQLKWLLEGISVPADRHRKIKGLTPYAKETFKGGRPTDKQSLALDMALNTPDLALIIGPPGTGKTQVIAALQRRLAEEFEAQNISGQVLVSSFQHDAVDNALDRSLVFNLPANRVGAKKQNADEQGNFSLWVDAQACYLKEQIAQQYQTIPVLQKLDDISLTMVLLRVSQLTAAQFLGHWEKLLGQLKDLAQSGLRVSAQLLNEVETYIEMRLPIPQITFTGDNPGVLRSIRALRVTTQSFADDGNRRAEELLRKLNRNLHRFVGESKHILERASTTNFPDLDLLQRLTDLKNQLLDRYLPDYRPPELKLTLGQDGVNLLNRLEASLEHNMQKHKQSAAWALQELVNSIETDRQSALKTTQEYAMVVGATCQQSAGDKMARLKTVLGLDSSDIEFDTVIIDEAARANPLDLFIPMAMAKRRIVLVGDDRQLPHMLEPDIEAQLQDEHQLTERQLAAFKSSLFERMRIQLNELQGKDNICRVVMLDTQFRMHPVLGDFISRQFYESAGLEKVNAGRSEDDFTFHPQFIEKLGDQGEHFSGKVCQWIDIPSSAGKAIMRGSIQIREAEAERIANEVRMLFEAAGNSLSVGIITFYATQRDLIMEKLATTQLDGVPMMIEKEGSYEPHDQFKWAVKQQKDGTLDKEEGLRVGTVDAFQGKEFDVVLLSCVRTWQKPGERKSDSVNDNSSQSGWYDRQLNKMFGFLRLPNRMNVAMSRQRQMLICVGDAKLATNEYAKDGVPALSEFYKLCGGKHGSLR